MWWTKGCPKCSGDLFEDKQIGDSDIKCLQCGYVLRPQDLMALKESLRTAKATVPARRIAVEAAA